MKKKDKEKKPKKVLKKKYRNILLVIIILIALCTLLLSAVNIYGWYMDGQATKKQIDEIEETVEVVEIEDSDTTEIIEQELEIQKNNPYWDYIKQSLIDVDFNELLNRNSDTVAWLQVNGTNMNYPVVQASDNDYYLKRSFDKSYNEAGWVFMDYRNDADNLMRNTIFYGHGRFDNTMFGSLKNIFKGNWFKNSNNFTVKVATPTESTLWQVFSVYIIPTTSDYLYVDFATDEDFLAFGNMLLERSQYDFGTTISPTDKIITLSTCYDGNKDRVVLHAKLIKREARGIQ